MSVNIRLVINGDLEADDAGDLVFAPADEDRPAGEFTRLQTLKMIWGFQSDLASNQSLSPILRFTRTFSHTLDDQLAERLLIGEKSRGAPDYIPGTIYLLDQNKAGQGNDQIRARLRFDSAYVQTVTTQDDIDEPHQEVVLIVSGHHVAQSDNDDDPIVTPGFSPDDPD